MLFDVARRLFYSRSNENSEILINFCGEQTYNSWKKFRNRSSNSNSSNSGGGGASSSRRSDSRRRISRSNRSKLSSSSSSRSEELKSEKRESEVVRRKSSVVVDLSLENGEGGKVKGQEEEGLNLTKEVKSNAPTSSSPSSSSSSSSSDRVFSGSIYITRHGERLDHVDRNWLVVSRGVVQNVLKSASGEVNLLHKF